MNNELEVLPPSPPRPPPSTTFRPRRAHLRIYVGKKSKADI